MAKVLKKGEESLLFLVEHFDPLPRLKKQYLLRVYVLGNKIDVEMTDLKTNKKFLKRSAAPDHIVRDDFFIGATVLLYSRELVLVDFGDMTTKSLLQHQMQQSVIIIPAEHQNMQQNWGKIIDEALSQGLLIVRAKSVLVPADVAEKACAVLGVGSRASGWMQSTVGVLVMCVQGEDGLEKIQRICSKYDSTGSLNSDGSPLLCALRASEAAELKELLLEGNRPLQSSVTLDSNTCCIIKPHAIKAKLAGKIVDHLITQSYEISALSTLYFDKAAAEEFLEVYDGVVPEYKDHVIELCSGMALAMELRAVDAGKSEFGLVIERGYLLYTADYLFHVECCIRHMVFFNHIP